jgi:hypothetical protein
VILCDEWTEAQVKAFRLMVNRSITWADWDDDLLALELDLHRSPQNESYEPPTGNNTQGRVTMVFRGNWAQAGIIVRSLSPRPQDHPEKPRKA